jgi:hypothetical protein
MTPRLFVPMILAVVIGAAAVSQARSPRALPGPRARADRMAAPPRHRASGADAARFDAARFDPARHDDA